MPSVRQVVVAALVALVGCAKPHPGPQGTDAHVGDAGTARSASRGTPFVLAGSHAIEEAVWLADGKLLARSDEDLFVVDPERPQAPVHHVPLPRPLGKFASARGARSFVTSDDETVTLWDARTLTPQKRLASFSQPGAKASAQLDAAGVVFAPDGRTLAVELCDGPKYDENRVYRDPVCAWGLFDAESGERLGTAPRLKKEYAGMLGFSNDGAYVVLEGAGEAVIGGARTGGEIVRRRATRVSEGGSIKDLFVIEDKRLVMSRGSSVEVFDLEKKTGIATGRFSVGPADESVSFAHDAATSRVAVVDGARKRVSVWNYATKGAPKVFTGKGPEDVCTFCDATFDGESLLVGERRLDLATGSFSALGTEAGREDIDHAGGWILRRTGGGASAKAHACVVVDGSGNERLLPWTPCERGPEGGMHPKLRSDGRFVAGVGGGGARIVDVKTLAEVAGVGPMVVEPMAQFRTVAVAAGKARISLALGHQGRTMWLTQGPPPSIFDPPHGKNATVARTDTHLFVVEDEREGRTLTVYDPAGKELRKERMARFDASQIASKSVTLLRQGGCDELLCEADKPCRSVSLHGFVHSLFYPWVIVHPRAVCSDKEGERRLVDLRDGSSRALDGCEATGMLISDAPLIVCGGDTEEKVVTPDGKVVRTLPKKRSGPRHGTSSVVNAMPFRFGLGVTNFGLEPGERMNLETGERVELFFGNDFALAHFPDGAIERFGQRDAATRFLYCKDGSELLPWSACASTADVTGRF